MLTFGRYDDNGSNKNNPSEWVTLSVLRCEPEIEQNVKRMGRNREEEEERERERETEREKLSVCVSVKVREMVERARQKEELLGAPGPETQPCNFVPCSFCSGSKKMERDLN